jgi:hypothetical protein
VPFQRGGIIMSILLAVNTQSEVFHYIYKLSHKLGVLINNNKSNKNKLNFIALKTCDFSLLI